MPEPARDLLAGTNYSTLKYNHTDNKYRMIGTLGSLHKIEANYILTTYEQTIRQLSTHEMGDYAVSQPHGITKYYHRLQTLLHKPDTEHVALQIDITSAYPNSSRPHIRSQLAKYLLVFIPIFDTLFKTPNNHQLLTSDQGPTTVTQEIGIIAGSELSSLFFMLLSDIRGCQ